MSLAGVNGTVLELIAAITGVMLAAIAIVFKIFWDSIMAHKREMALCISNIECDIEKHQKKIEKVESFMEQSFVELKELQNKSIQTNIEASSKLTVAITKINATLDYVIKPQDRHEEEIDKLKDRGLDFSLKK